MENIYKSVFTAYFTSLFITGNADDSVIKQIEPFIDRRTAMNIRRCVRKKIAEQFM